MPDFNPNEMDALFRDGAERHEFEYNPDAWALMEEKLDKKAKKRRVFFFLMGLMFFVVIAGAIYLLNFDNSNIQTAIATDIPLNSNEVQIEKNNDKIIIIDNGQSENKASIDLSKTKKEYVSSNSKESRSNIGAQNSFQSENTGNLMGHEVVSIDSQIDLPKIEDLKESYSLPADEDANSNFSEKGDSLNFSREIVLVALIKNKEISEIEPKEFDLNSFDLQPTQSDQILSVPQLSNRWSLTALANPEWSSVGLFKESKVGWSLGTRIGYQFANKFELNAGVAYSRKIYKGGGEAYTMNGGWYDNIEPMQMDAKCDVIEIPIGLTYYINGFRKSGFFADLGINSYMLHSEWYGFEYDDALVRPDRYMEVNEDSQNSHLIGVGRIAIGYQKIVSKNTSFQIAPYLQFPLTGIGAGQVNVYSSGVQFAVKFNTQ